MHSLDLFSVPWVLAFCTVLFAAFVRGIVGFGFALVFVPILLLILSPKSVVIISLILGLFGHIFIVRYGLRNVYFKKIVFMAVSSLLGIPLGIWIITAITPSDLKVYIGGVTIVFAMLLVFGFHKAFTREKLASSIFGFLSGILWTSTSMGGPPAVLFMHNQNWRKEAIHSSLAAYFIFGTSCSLIALFISGFIDSQLLVSAFSLAPALLIGIGLGMLTFRRINRRFFRGLSLAIIICAGILGILSGLGVFPY